MPMQVTGKPRAGRATQVEPDVKTVRLQDASIGGRQASQLVHAAQEFAVVQVVKLCLVREGCHENVAIVVRKAVQLRERMLAATDDEVLRVTLFIAIPAQETPVLVGFAVFGGGDVC